MASPIGGLGPSGHSDGSVDRIGVVLSTASENLENWRLKAGSNPVEMLSDMLAYQRATDSNMIEFSGADLATIMFTWYQSMSSATEIGDDAWGYVHWVIGQLNDSSAKNLLLLYSGILLVNQSELTSAYDRLYAVDVSALTPSAQIRYATAMGSIYDMQGIGNSTPLYEAACAINTDDIEEIKLIQSMRYTLIERAMHSWDYPKVKAHCQSYISEPGDLQNGLIMPNILHFLAIASFALNEYGEAAETMEIALIQPDIRPAEHLEFSSRLGYYKLVKLMVEGKYDKVITAAQAYLKGDTTYTPQYRLLVQAMLGIAHFHLNQYDRAVIELNRLPLDGIPLSETGINIQKLAIDCYRKADLEVQINVLRTGLEIWAPKGNHSAYLDCGINLGAGLDELERFEESRNAFNETARYAVRNGCFRSFYEKMVASHKSEQLFVALNLPEVKERLENHSEWVRLLVNKTVNLVYDEETINEGIDILLNALDHITSPRLKVVIMFEVGCATDNDALCLDLLEDCLSDEYRPHLRAEEYVAAQNRLSDEA